MRALNTGDIITIRSTGASGTVLAQSGTNVLVRRSYGQWTYSRCELRAAGDAGAVCALAT